MPLSAELLLYTVIFSILEIEATQNSFFRYVKILYSREYSVESILQACCKVTSNLSNASFWVNLRNICWLIIDSIPDNTKIIVVGIIMVE